MQDGIYCYYESPHKFTYAVGPESHERCNISCVVYWVPLWALHRNCKMAKDADGGCRKVSKSKLQKRPIQPYANMASHLPLLSSTSSQLLHLEDLPFPSNSLTIVFRKQICIKISEKGKDLALFLMQHLTQRFLHSIVTVERSPRYKRMSARMEDTAHSIILMKTGIGVGNRSASIATKLHGGYVVHVDLFVRLWERLFVRYSRWLYKGWFVSQRNLISICRNDWTPFSKKCLVCKDNLKTILLNKCMDGTFFRLVRLNIWDSCIAK